MTKDDLRAAIDFLHQYYQPGGYHARHFGRPHGVDYKKYRSACKRVLRANPPDEMLETCVGITEFMSRSMGKSEWIATDTVCNASMAVKIYKAMRRAQD